MYVLRMEGTIHTYVGVDSRKDPSYLFWIFTSSFIMGDGMKLLLHQAAMRVMHLGSRVACNIDEAFSLVIYLRRGAM